MNKKNLSLLLMISVLLVTLLAGCGQDKKAAAPNAAAAKPEAEKTYIIACDAKYAPFSFEENGKYKGIDVELIAAIAKAEGFKYELKPMDFSGIIPAIKAGQIDGSIAGMNITKKRQESIDFSDGYIKSGSSIVVNIKNTDVKTLDDLKGKTAAVKKGTTGAIFAEENQKKYDLKISYYDDSPSMFQAVKNGNADFLVEDYPVISYQIKVSPEKNFRVAVPEIEAAPFNGFAVDKGKNQKLLAMFNSGLKKLKDNGEYAKIVGQYLPLDK